MKLNIQLSDEIKQELDNLNEKVDRGMLEAKTTLATELVEAKKDLRQLVMINLIAKGVMTAAALVTVAWIVRGTPE